MMPIVTGVISCPLLEDKNFLKSYIYNQTSQKTLKKENKDNEKREKICEYQGKIQIVIIALNSIQRQMATRGENSVWAPKRW